MLVASVITRIQRQSGAMNMKYFEALFGYIAAIGVALTAGLAVFVVGALIANSGGDDAVAGTDEPVVAAPDSTPPPADEQPQQVAEAAPPAVVEEPASTISAEAGADVFKKCKSCHTIDQGGPNRVGPNLWGVFNRDVASHDGFSYSDSMVATLGGQSWTPALLNEFLTKPKDLVSGTKMSFGGLRNPDDRQNLIAYLAQQSDTPVGVEALGFAAGAGPDAAAAIAAPATGEENTFLAGFHNPAPRSADEQAAIDARVAALRAEVAGIDYERARFHPIHFPPMIEQASNEECLVCHQEIMDNKPLQSSPAGVPASDTMAWYQTLATYDGEQASFHFRHLQSDYAKQVMNLECTFCHQGNDPREESPDMMRGRPAFSASDTPEFTLRKMVNPSTTCLRCHGAMPDPENIMGLPGAWPEARQDFEDEETPNGCLTCHGEYGYRTNRHNVSYLNAANIEDLATASSDVCYGCHGGRQWYRISYPYPRHPWPDMDPETPDWALDRPTQSDPAYQLAPVAAE